MSIFTIADTHLSLSDDKPMDIFGGWQDYVTRLESNWKSLITDDDTVVVPGDISWAMSLEGALEDFRFIHNLPGKKIILKGNHDYWWNTKRKMDAWLENESLDTISILHNNAFKVGDYVICGTRGWFYDAEKSADMKVLLREASRLERSIEEGKKLGENLIVFLHYPPVYGDGISAGIIDIMREYGVKRCFYGHLHGPSCRMAFTGEYLGINFELISADHLGFCLKRL